MGQMIVYQHSVKCSCKANYFQFKILNILLFLGWQWSSWYGSSGHGSSADWPTRHRTHSRCAHMNCRSQWWSGRYISRTVNWHLRFTGSTSWNSLCTDNKNITKSNDFKYSKEIIYFTLYFLTTMAILIILIFLLILNGNLKWTKFLSCSNNTRFTTEQTYPRHLWLCLCPKDQVHGVHGSLLGQTCRS